MSRLGEKLSSSVSNENDLVEGNINFEAEILESLQKKEAEAAKAETQIEQIANARESLADDLMETERSIMMLEKKLELAKEMREALWRIRTEINEKGGFENGNETEANQKAVTSNCARNGICT